MCPDAEFALVLGPRGPTGEARGNALGSTWACRLGRYYVRMASAFLPWLLNNPRARLSVHSPSGQHSRECISGWYAGWTEAEKPFGSRNSGTEDVDQGGDRGGIQEREDSGDLEGVLRMLIGNSVELEFATGLRGRDFFGWWW